MPTGRVLLQTLNWAHVRQVSDSIPVRVASADRERRLLYITMQWSSFYAKQAGAVLSRTITEVHEEEIFTEVRPWAERPLVRTRPAPTSRVLSLRWLLSRCGGCLFGTFNQSDLSTKTDYIPTSEAADLAWCFTTIRSHDALGDTSDYVGK